MPLPRGHCLPLSFARQMVGDVMHASRGIPLVTVERRIFIPEVSAARLRAHPKPGWYPILLKAFAHASMAVPQLRRSLLTFPYPRLYQHACTVASVAVEREVHGEPAVLAFQVRQAECTPLLEIDRLFQRAKFEPLESIGEFRRLLRIARLPRLARRFVWWLGLRVSGSYRERFTGTFASSSVVAAGGTLVNPVHPLSAMFIFGPVGDDGSLMLRLVFDHRVLDGVAAACGLVAVESALKSNILDELRALTTLRAAI